MNSIKKDYKPLYFSLYVLVIIGLLIYLLKFVKTYNFIELRYIIFSSFWFLLSFLLEKTLKVFISRVYENFITKIVISLRLGLTLFIFLFLLPNNNTLNISSFGVLFLTIILIMTIFLKLIENYIVMNSLLRALCHLLSGLSFLYIFQVIWHGVLDLGIRISVSYIFVGGFIFLSICTILSLLQLTSNPFLKKTGVFFNRGYIYKFLTFCFLIFIFKDFREFLSERFSDNYVLVEWLIILAFVVCISAYAVIRIRKIDNSPMHKEFKKYKNDTGSDKDQALYILGRHLDDFINNGSKNNLIIDLLYLAKDAKLSYEIINKVFLDPILEYEDILYPVFCLRSEKTEIDHRNTIRREKIVKNIVSKIKISGGV